MGTCGLGTKRISAIMEYAEILLKCATLPDHTYLGRIMEKYTERLATARGQNDHEM